MLIYKIASNVKKRNSGKYDHQNCMDNIELKQRLQIYSL